MLDFGAKPDDSTDCTVPFQNACDAMKDGDFLFFPAGTYRTTQTVDVAGRGVTAGRLGGPKLIHGVTLFGTRSSVIHHKTSLTLKGPRYGALLDNKASLKMKPCFSAVPTPAVTTIFNASPR